MPRRTHLSTLTALIFVFAAPLPLDAVAAAASRHALQAGFDTSWHMVRDDALVPISHQGPQLALTPRYYGDLAAVLVLSDGRLGVGYAQDRHGAEALTFAWGLGVSALFVVGETARGGMALGPALAWDNHTFFLGDWDDAHAYWIGAGWVGPRASSWRWLSERWRVDLSGQLSLLGFVSRPPAYRHDKQETSPDISPFLLVPTRDPEFAWLGNLRVARASVDFYRASQRTRVPTGWGFGSELRLANASEPSPAFAFETTLRVSHSWGM